MLNDPRFPMAAAAITTVLMLVFDEKNEGSLYALTLAGAVVGWFVRVPSVVLARATWTLVAVSAAISLATLTPAPAGAVSTAGHVVGGGLLAWVLVESAARSAGWARLTGGGSARVVVGLVLAIGGVWELGELAAERAWGADVWGGIGDTAVDLLADLVGALAGVWIARLHRPTLQFGVRRT